MKLHEPHWNCTWLYILHPSHEEASILHFWVLTAQQKKVSSDNVEAFFSCQSLRLFLCRCGLCTNNQSPRNLRQAVSRKLTTISQACKVQTINPFLRKRTVPCSFYAHLPLFHHTQAVFWTQIGLLFPNPMYLKCIASDQKQKRLLIMIGNDQTWLQNNGSAFIDRIQQWFGVIDHLLKMYWLW